MGYSSSSISSILVYLTHFTVCLLAIFCRKPDSTAANDKTSVNFCNLVPRYRQRMKRKRSHSPPIRTSRSSHSPRSPRSTRASNRSPPCVDVKHNEEDHDSSFIRRSSRKRQLNYPNFDTHWMTQDIVIRHREAEKACSSPKVACLDFLFKFPKLTNRVVRSMERPWPPRIIKRRIRDPQHLKLSPRFSTAYISRPRPSRVHQLGPREDYDGTAVSVAWLQTSRE